MKLRTATIDDVPEIWNIIQFAIAQRKADGSDQWQYGYPNEQSILADINNQHGYVIEENGIILLYAAIIFGIDEAYNEIEGAWLNDNDYVVLHRLAIAEIAKGRGIAMHLFKEVETLAQSKNVYNIRVDTNYDNIPMLKLMDRLHYIYCAEVQMGGGTREAFQKILFNN